MTLLAEQPERQAAPRLSAALAPVAALLLGTALLYLGYGLQTTLVPLRADAEGFDRIAIGLMGSAFYAGFVAGSLSAPFVIVRAGHIRAFAAMVSCVSAAALSFPLLIGEEAWIVFRFAVGFCMAGVNVIIESWLNEKSTVRTRGTVMSAYVIIMYGMMTVGQLGVSLQPLTSFTLFSICSIVLSLAAVPVVLTKASQPAPIPLVRIGPRLIFGLAPAAVAGTFTAGIMTGALFSLGAIYAIDRGFTVDEAAYFISAAVAGGALAQYPFGRTSDFVDRRIVLIASVTGAALVSLVLALMPTSSQVMVLVVGFFAGAFILPTYSLAAAHGYDRTEYEDMVETSAGLILAFGIGSTLGPVIASLAMGFSGAGGLFMVIAIAATALAAFVGLRIAVNSRPDEENRSDFDIYSTAPVGATLTPEPIAEDDPALEFPPQHQSASAQPPEPAAHDPSPLSGAAGRTDMDSEGGAR